MLGLLLLLAHQAEAFVESEILFSAGQVNVIPKTPAHADIWSDVTRGLKQLDQWLINLIKNGLGEPQVQTFPFWDEIADRMWAAWMPGLSQQLREIARLPINRGDWVEPLLDELGRLYLLVQSWDRFEELTLEVRADICEMIGCRQLIADAPADSQRDQWLVLGQRLKRLRDQSTEHLIWLRGRQSGRMALLREIDAYGVVVSAPVEAGQTLDATLNFLPSRTPLIVTVDQVHGAAESAFQQGVSIPEAIADFGQALARNPWLKHYPVLLDEVYVTRFDKGWTVRHTDGTYLPIASGFQYKWIAYASSSRQPIQMAATWNGRELIPLSVRENEHTIELNSGMPYKR